MVKCTYTRKLLNKNTITKRSVIFIPLKMVKIKRDRMNRFAYTSQNVIFLVLFAASNMYAVFRRFSTKTKSFCAFLFQFHNCSFIWFNRDHYAELKCDFKQKKKNTHKLIDVETIVESIVWLSLWIWICLDKKFGELTFCSLNRKLNYVFANKFI